MRLTQVYKGQVFTREEAENVKNIVKQVELTWLSARVALIHHGVHDEVQAEDEVGRRAEKKGFVTVCDWVLEELTMKRRGYEERRVRGAAP
jgi:hypothetical protein